MIEYTDFGKSVKKELVERGMTQKQLIEKVREMTGLYVDRSYIHRVSTGKINNPKVVGAIKEILELA